MTKSISERPQWSEHYNTRGLLQDIEYNLLELGSQGQNHEGSYLAAFQSDLNSANQVQQNLFAGELTLNNQQNFPKQAVRTVKPSRRKAGNKAQAQGDYTKNICSYIIKRVLRDFLAEQNIENVNKICVITGCLFPAVKEHFDRYLIVIIGPRRLHNLIVMKSDNKGSAGQGSYQLRLTFSVFLVWYLRERYVRFVVEEGKMILKDRYIQYKNKIMLKLFYPKPEVYEVLRQFEELLNQEHDMH